MSTRAKTALHALSSGLLSFVLVAAFIASPLFVATAEAVETAEATDTIKATDTVESANTTTSDVTAIKISLNAYPLASDGETWDVDAGKTTIINENGGKLRLSVRAKWSDGVVTNEYEEEDWAARGGFGQGFTYVSSDEDALAVDPRGILTAIADGKTTITATPKNSDYSSLSASITITTANQGTGLVVQKIQIVDEDNTPYGDKSLSFTKLNQVEKLYARVTYKDKSDDNKKLVLSNAPGAPSAQTDVSSSEYSSVEEAFSNLEWWAGDVQYLNVEVRDTVASVIALANATTRIYASISGADPTQDEGMGLGVVYDSVSVSINNGTTLDDNLPADALTIKVVYESDLDNVVKKVTYTPDEFEDLGAITRTYTLTQSAGKYVTDRAYGVPIATLLSELGIATDDISYFTLAANDGANPGKLSCKWLLKRARYYLPNYDIGGSWAEKEQVPTMLALKDSWNANTTVTGEMNSGTRFRLVFGSATSADGATSKSIKWINTFTIVMSGSAPSSHGDSDDAQANDDDSGDAGDGGSGGAGTSGSGGQAGQSADGSGTSNGSGTGAGGKDTGQAAGAGDTGGTGASESGTAAGEKTTINGHDVTEISDKDAQDKTQPKTDEAADTLASRQAKADTTPWRIYEMMNPNASDLSVRYADNPLLPYAPFAAGLVIVVAALWRYVRFRRGMSGLGM